MTLAIAAGQAFEPWFGPDALTDPEAPVRLDAQGCRVDAPGLYAFDGRLVAVLPHCFAERPPAPKHHPAAAIAMVRVLSSYRQRRQRLVVDAERSVALRATGDGVDLLHQLEAVLLLDADHRQHGPLHLTRRQRGQRRPGRIDWPRTVRHSVHVVAPDGNITVPDPWHTRQALAPRDPLTELHAHTVGAGRALLLGEPAPPAVWARHDALALLRRREHELFQDRHRTVHGHLWRFHEARGGPAGAARRRVGGLYASDFALIWEAMLDTALGGRASVAFQGDYHLVDGGTSLGAHLRPDTIVDLDDVCLVVDAKHYTRGTLPRTESLAKQFLYRWMLSAESGHGHRPLAAIRNVFALPGRHPESPVRLLATHRLRSEHGDADFGVVWAVSIDYDRVAEAFVDGRLDAGLQRTLVDVTHPT